MTASNNLLVLIADGDEADRNRMAELLDMHGYRVIQAIDGGSAIKVLQEWSVDLAIIAHRMSPHDGIEVAKHILVKGLDVGIVLLSDNTATDLLVEAGRFEISQVLQKPVAPDRLVSIVRRVLRARGRNPDAISMDSAKAFKPEELMQRAIVLARQNARSKMGGPFGAVVADQNGVILGEGVNGVTARCDPTAHAEVLAIRRATEKLSTPRLDGCVLYCSSEPTMLGQALILGTGIKQVYYGLSHEETGAIRVNDDGILGEIAKPLSARTPPYNQLLHTEAAILFGEWRAQKDKVQD